MYNLGYPATDVAGTGSGRPTSTLVYDLVTIGIGVVHRLHTVPRPARLRSV